jgi:hypothetical protein
MNKGGLVPYLLLKDIMSRKITPFKFLIPIAGLMLFLFTACQDEIPTDEGSGAFQVVFKITEVDGGLKSTVNCAWDVDYAQVIISVRDNKNRLRRTDKYYAATTLNNGVLYTNPVTLPKPDKGEYFTLEDCLLYADDDKVHANPVGDLLISAAPHEGSYFGTKITTPLNLQFEINAFNKTSVGLSVFCFNGNPADFGFIWYQPTQIEVREKWFYGSFMPANYLDYKGSVYEQKGDLSVNMPALYKVKVYRDANGNGALTTDELVAQYSNEIDYLNGDIKPMSVKFPERTTGYNHYGLEFWGYLKSSSGFQYQQIGVLYFEDNDPNLYRTPALNRNLLTDLPITPGPDNIFEFVISSSTQYTGDLRFGI